jgi:glycosyltransferase EpsF
LEAILKKVIVVVDNLNRGGISTVVLGIHNLINKETFKIDYITYIKPDSNIEKLIKKHNSNIFIVKRLSQTTPIKYIMSIKNILKANGPYDAIHVHTSSFIWLACIAAKLQKIPVRIGHAHGSKNVTKFPLSNIIYALLKVMNRNFCTVMLACSDPSGKFTFGKDYHFIPNLVDYYKFAPISKPDKKDFLNKYKLSESSDKYSFVGYLGGEKNPFFALKLFNYILRNNSNSYLLIAGDGPDLYKMKNYILKNNMVEKVVLLGNTNEINKVLHISDILLMPSFTEGMSLTLLEAQISGVPCIVSKGVPITNNIKAGLFHQCKSYEINEWSETIKDIFTDDIKVNFEDSVKCLKGIGYDKETVISKIENIYNGNIFNSQELINEKKNK